MTGIDGLEFQGVANIGIRPTVTGSNNVVLETFLFNFNQDIYGCFVEVHFKQKLRAERRFQTVDELKEQIVSDVAVAKKFFATQSIKENGL